MCFREHFGEAGLKKKKNVHSLFAVNGLGQFELRPDTCGAGTGTGTLHRTPHSTPQHTADTTQQNTAHRRYTTTQHTTEQHNTT